MTLSLKKVIVPWLNVVLCSDIVTFYLASQNSVLTDYPARCMEVAVPRAWLVMGFFLSL